MGTAPAAKKGKNAVRLAIRSQLGAEPLFTFNKNYPGNNHSVRLFICLSVY